jgi:hypothetical protein
MCGFVQFEQLVKKLGIFWRNAMNSQNVFFLGASEPAPVEVWLLYNGMGTDVK